MAGRKRRRFRKIIEKLPEKKPKDQLNKKYEWDNFKRRYSLYFWSELLLEEIIKGSSKKQKERIKNILDQLDEKSELHRKIEKIIRSNSNTT